MKLQTVGRGDQQKKGAFFPGKAFKDMVDDLALESAGEALDVKE